MACIPNKAGYELMAPLAEAGIAEALKKNAPLDLSVPSFVFSCRFFLTALPAEEHP